MKLFTFWCYFVTSFEMAHPFNIATSINTVTSVNMTSLMSRNHPIFAGFQFVASKNKDNKILKLIAGAPKYEQNMDNKPWLANGNIIECSVTLTPDPPLPMTTGSLTTTATLTTTTSMYENATASDVATSFPTKDHFTTTTETNTDTSTNESSYCSVVVYDSQLYLERSQAKQNDALGLSVLKQTDDNYLVCAPGRLKFCGSLDEFMPGACYSGSLSNLTFMTGWGEVPCFDSFLSLVFLVDSSGSINSFEFNLMRKVLVNVSTVFAASLESGNTELAVVQYGNTPIDDHDKAPFIPLYFPTPLSFGECSDEECAHQKIEAMRHSRGAYTYTAYAIRQVVEHVFPSATLSGPNYNKVIVLITDGIATDRSKLIDSYYLTEANNITVYAVGVRGGSLADLKVSANGNTSDARVISVNDFESLSVSLGDIVQQITMSQAEGTQSTDTFESAAFGLSSHYNNKNNQTYISGVNSFGGRGTIAQYSYNSTSDPTSLNNVDVTDVLTNQSSYSYFGYAISSGNFEGGETYFVASGAPRHLLQGVVLVYESAATFTSSARQISFKNCSTCSDRRRQLGSYFGGVLLSSDINGDLKDDLFVGAPLYVGESYDEGRVFVYLSQDSNSIDTWANSNYQPIELHGLKLSGSRFGSAMTSAGDLNDDGFNDVIISAPLAYEGSGAVYIYNGGSQGLSVNPTQEILATEVSSSPLLYFGQSLQGEIDVNDNSIPDVAIGAPRSDTVVFLRTRPVVRFQGNVTLIPDKVDIFECLETLNLNCLKVQSCVMANGKSVEDIIGATVVLKFDEYLSRFEFRTNPNSTMTGSLTKTLTFNLMKGKPVCTTYQLYLKRKIIDYTTPVTVDMIASLTKEHLVYPLSSVTDPNLPNIWKGTSTFNKGCGNDTLCSYDLNIDAILELPSVTVNIDNKTLDLTDFGSTLVIASSKQIRLKVNLTNSGENVFDPRITVLYSPALTWGNLPNNLIQSSNPLFPSCIEVANDITLSVNSSLKSQVLYYQYDRTLGSIMLGGSWCYFEILLNPQFLSQNSSIDEIQIQLVADTIFSDSQNDSNAENNFWNSTNSVRYQSDVLVKKLYLDNRILLPENYNPIDQVVYSLSEISSPVVQMYWIAGLGYSNISKSQFTLTYPSQMTSQYRLLYLYNVACQTLGDSNAECLCDTSQVNIFNLPLDLTILRNGTNETIQANPNQNVKSIYDCSKNNLVVPSYCETLNCDITNLKAGDVIEFSASFRVWKPTFNFNQNQSRVTMRSGFSYNTELSSFIVNQFGENKTVINLRDNILVLTSPEVVVFTNPLWIYFVSAIAALILLGLTILILYKLGFFRSKYAEMKEDALHSDETGTQISGIQSISGSIF